MMMFKQIIWTVLFNIVQIIIYNKNLNSNYVNVNCRKASATLTSHSESLLKVQGSCAFCKLLTAACLPGENCDAKLTLV